MAYLVPKCVSDQSVLPIIVTDQIKDCGWFKRMKSINVGSLKCAPKPTPAPVPVPVPVSNPAPVPSTPANPPSQPDKGRSTESSNHMLLKDGLNLNSSFSNEKFP